MTNTMHIYHHIVMCLQNLITSLATVNELKYMKLVGIIGRRAPNAALLSCCTVIDVLAAAGKEHGVDILQHAYKLYDSNLARLGAVYKVVNDEINILQAEFLANQYTGDQIRYHQLNRRYTRSPANSSLDTTPQRRRTPPNRFNIAPSTAKRRRSSISSVTNTNRSTPTHKRRHSTTPTKLSIESDNNYIGSGDSSSSSSGGDSNDTGSIYCDRPAATPNNPVRQSRVTKLNNNLQHAVDTNIMNLRRPVSIEPPIITMDHLRRRNVGFQPFSGIQNYTSPPNNPIQSQSINVPTLITNPTPPIVVPPLPRPIPIRVSSVDPAPEPTVLPPSHTVSIPYTQLHKSQSASSRLNTNNDIPQLIIRVLPRSCLRQAII